MDGDGEEDGSTNESDPQPRSPRIRQYPIGAKGPFVVNFRKLSVPLKVLLISAELYSKFTSIKEVKKVNDFKVRVILSKREEANEVVKMKRFEGVYRMYIPCEDVEVDGVIYDETLTPEVVMQHGEGGFDNRALPSVPVVDCERLTTLSSDKSSRVDSSALRITFAGTMIPDFINVSKAIIPVRVYTPKVMLCSRCNTFGHTEKFCSNKGKCIKCGQDHESAKCPTNSNTCILCKGSHDLLTTCKAYQEVRKQAKNKLVARSRANRAELLNAVHAPIPTSNMFSPLGNESAADSTENDLQNQAHCSYRPPQRKRKTNSGFKSPSVDQQGSFASSLKHFPTLRPTKDVPGFRRVEQTEVAADPVSEILKSLCRLFGANPTWCGLVESVAPVLSKIWEALKTLLPLLSPLIELFGCKNGE